jgi:hypothetical protein
LAILCGAAALPRGLLMVAFVTLIATAAVVIVFEVAPTGSSLCPEARYRRCRRAAT